MSVPHENEVGRVTGRRSGTKKKGEEARECDIAAIWTDYGACVVRAIDVSGTSSAISVMSPDDARQLAELLITAAKHAESAPKAGA